MGYMPPYSADGGKRAFLSWNLTQVLLNARRMSIRQECIRGTIIRDPFPLL